MSLSNEKIFELLPAIHRIRDAESGGALKALMDVISDRAVLAEQDIDQLYRNWFIETCEEWVVPYIGDLLGVRNFHTITDDSVLSQRSYVANTLSYRRRKGIAPVLEQLALDVTGWRAHATEFFQLLATTQYMNHIRLQRTVTPDLRKMNELDLLNTAFDTIAHTADVRHTASGRGRHNISNLGLFIWRLQSYPVVRSDARRMLCPGSPPDESSAYFTFDPLGKDICLFNRPETETRITHVSEEINVPGMLRRRALYDELQARRQAAINGDEVRYAYFDDRLEDEDAPDTRHRPVFEIYAGNEIAPVDPSQILICNLESCCSLASTVTCEKRMPDGSISDVQLPVRVGVDPERGRFLFTDTSIQEARVSYSYGFSGDLGAGTFSRQDSVLRYLGQPGTWQVGVSRSVNTVGTETIYASILEAVIAWNALPAGTIGIISILDSSSYIGDLDIYIPENSRLLLTAAQWPLRNDPDPTVEQQWRLQGEIVASDLRPHLRGAIRVQGTLADRDLKSGGSLHISGLLVEGALELRAGNLGKLELSHTTLAPGWGGLVSTALTKEPTANQWLELHLKRCICGGVQLAAMSAASLLVEDCILDVATGHALQAVNTSVQLTRSTFIGEVHARTINAENSIFYAAVTAERRQEGCIRFSYVPGKNPLAPRRYHCQPELEVDTAIEAREKKTGPMTVAQRTALRNSIYQWLVPAFTSLHFGHHAYAQLSFSCPQQIRSGADDGSEMGAFCFLQQPQRQANLRIAMDEYLPLGLEAGMIYVT